MGGDRPLWHSSWDHLLGQERAAKWVSDSAESLQAVSSALLGTPGPFEYQYPLLEGKSNRHVVQKMMRSSCGPETRVGNLGLSLGSRNYTKSQRLPRYGNFIPAAEMAIGIRSGDGPPPSPVAIRPHSGVFTLS